MKQGGRAYALPPAYFLKTICPYKGAFCPNADRWYLSWWKENVNGPLGKITTAEKKEEIWGKQLKYFRKVV